MLKMMENNKSAYRKTVDHLRYLKVCIYNIFIFIVQYKIQMYEFVYIQLQIDETRTSIKHNYSYIRSYSREKHIPLLRNNLYVQLL